MTARAPHLRTSTRRVVRGCVLATTIGDGPREVNRGQEPSTQHPLLWALARRVDWVLMAMSPPVDSCPAPTSTISLSSEVVVFRYLALADVPYRGDLLILYVVWNLTRYYIQTLSTNWLGLQRIWVLLKISLQYPPGVLPNVYNIYYIYNIYHIYRFATKLLPDNYCIIWCLQCLQCLQGFPEFADAL